MKAFISFLILLAYFAPNGYYCEVQATTYSPEKYRLPRSIFPELYELNVFTHLNDEEGFKFYGEVRILVIAKRFGLFCNKYKAHLNRLE